MVSLIALIFFFQAKPAPALPAGASPEFQASALAVERALAGSDFSKAKRLAADLPDHSVTASIDDSAVPVSERASMREAVESALKLWTKELAGFRAEIGPSPKVRFAFEKKLPVGDSGLPMGVLLRFSDGGPNMEAVIGLTRGNPGQSATREEVANEAVFALGSYLGVARSPLPGSSMGRTDAAGTPLLGLRPIDVVTAGMNLRIADILRQAAASETRMTPSEASAELDKTVLDAGAPTQGEVIPFTIHVTNHGGGPLSYRVQPDCGCFAPIRPGTIAPGASGDIHVLMDTTEFFGKVHKRLAFFSNDPEKAAIEIPVEANIQPRYRFLFPGGPVVVLPDGGKSIEVFLALPPGSTLEPTGAQFDGIPATVNFEPWSGNLPDPEMSEPARPRKGYRFMIDLGDQLPPGRAGATLTVETTDSKFPTIRFNLYAQKGIVALPDQLYLGEMEPTPQTASFLLSRPGADFEVTGVRCSAPELSATAEKLKGEDQYKIVVRYNGKATSGNYAALVVVTTDDPKQPKIVVPVTGIAK